VSQNCFGCCVSRPFLTDSLSLTNWNVITILPECAEILVLTSGTYRILVTVLYFYIRLIHVSTSSLIEVKVKLSL
jgi:hypothetical protein